MMEDVKESKNEDITELIEELTTTGSEILNEDDMKKLKMLCMNSELILKEAFKLLMQQLEKEHAEIRYSSFLIISELFSRSHLFRKLVANDLYSIFAYAVETDPLHNPSPLPANVAKKLKLYTLKVICQWNKTYGSYYRRIALGYEFLRDVKKVRFSVLEKKIEEEKRKEKELAKKEERHRKSKLLQIDMQIYDNYEDFKRNITELENCFELILPKVEEPNVQREKVNEEDLCDTDMDICSKNDESDFKNTAFGIIGSETGIPNRNYSVTIEFSTTLEIIEDDLNTDLIRRMDELYSEIDQQIIIVKKWLRSFVKYKEEDSSKVNKVLDLSKLLSSVRLKYLKMKIKRVCGSDDEDKFVDVPEKLPIETYVVVSSGTKKDSQGKSSGRKKKSVSSTIISQTCSKNNKYIANSKVIETNASQTIAIDNIFKGDISNLCCDVTSKDQSTLIGTSYKECRISPSVSDDQIRKEKLMKVAPVIPYGVDLEYWGKEIKPMASLKLDSQHRFWKTNEHVDEFVPPQLVEAMRTRVMSFPTKFEPVARKCGALISNGKLCERMDRFKCPFHGNIVERDGSELPIDPMNSGKGKNTLDKKEEETKLHLSSGDKESYTATGMPPYIKQKKLKKEKKPKVETAEDRRKARYARLSDIKSTSSSSKNRLEKKVFNKSAVNRVSQNLDSTMKRKQAGKFGDQFNYL